MAASSSSLRRVLRIQPLRVLSHYQKPLPLLPNPTPTYSDPKPGYSHPTPSISSQFYPTFSFGLFLNPNLHPSLIEVEHDEFAIPDDDSRTIRADSVKKKRKKKMNKHKLKKLRKRLRRKNK